MSQYASNDGTIAGVEFSHVDGIARKAKGMVHPSQGSRARMENFMKSSEFPKAVRDLVDQRKGRLADHMIYATKRLTGTSTKFFLTSDKKEIGLTNLDNGKLPKNSPLLVSKIVLLAATITPGAGNTDSAKEDVMTGLYKSIAEIGAFHTGVITVKSTGKKDIVSELPLNLFMNTGFTMERPGHYTLDNPRLIEDDLDIEAEMMLGSIKGIPNNVYVYLGLYGTTVIPC